MSGSSQPGAPPRRGWAASLIRGLCPRCRAAAVFRGTFAMHERCPHCGLRFEREQGYFMAAMYISYGVAVILITALYFLVSRLAPSLSYEMALGVAALLFLPLVPTVFRSSRIFWIYVDRTIDRG